MLSKRKGTKESWNWASGWNQWSSEKRLIELVKNFGYYCIEVSDPVETAARLEGIAKSLIKDRIGFLVIKDERGYVLYRSPDEVQCSRANIRILKNRFAPTPPENTWAFIYDGKKLSRYDPKSDSHQSSH